MEVQTFGREFCSTRVNGIRQVTPGVRKFRMDGMRSGIFNPSHQCSVVAFPVAIYACGGFGTMEAYFGPLSLRLTTLFPLGHGLPKLFQVFPGVLTRGSQLHFL